MEKYNNKYKLQDLKKQIDELRDRLNEVYVSMEKDSNSEETLRLSVCLDKLILEYMKSIDFKGNEKMI